MSAPIPSGSRSSSRTTAPRASVLIRLLRTMEQASSAFVPLQSAVRGLLVVIESVERAIRNAEDIVELETSFSNLLTVLQPSLRNSETDIVRMTESLQQLGRQGRFSRVLHADRDTGQVAAWVQRLKDIVDSFKLESAVATESCVGTIQSGVEQMRTEMQRGFDRIEGVTRIEAEAGRQVMAQVVTPGKPMPRCAPAARFDQAVQQVRVTCAENTRTEILETIHAWFSGERLATDVTLRTAGNPQGPVFWLDGVAGTGKSTIAQTVADRYHQTKQLGASFFCSRDNTDCSNVGLVFQTIAFQLSTFNPAFGKRVSEAMARDVYLQSALPSMQLEKLIIEPLEGVVREQGFPPCIIVIDALDECKDENTTSMILIALSYFAASDRFSPVKFFITSRPVANVVEGFHETGLMRDTSALVLHSIPSKISEKDIRVYLDTRLSRIARSCRLKSWPTAEALTRLVEQSSRLFIYAATVANFIEDRKASNPNRQLVAVLSTEPAASTANSPHRSLDGLYLTVLRAAFPDISEDQRTSLRTVLGTVVVLFDPLEAECLEGLLGLESGTVRWMLRDLHSIAIVPNNGDGPVRLLHPSFHDYLLDSDRCGDVNFVIDAQAQHKLLSERCLGVLQSLSSDMCKIGDASVLNQTVADRSTLISRHIPALVQYACRHWASHLSSGVIEDSTLDLLRRFCCCQLLNWLEVMSLLGDLDGAISALQSAHRVVMSMGTPEIEIGSLLDDCARATREFYPSISAGCLQVYGPRSQSGIVVKEGRESRWSACARVLEGHTNDCRCVAFSPDGGRLVSGSYDHTIRLWNVRTGALLHIMTGHDGLVTSVAYSPDGKLVASGSHDGTVRIWNAATGLQVSEYTGHLDEVQCIAFSADGLRIASACYGYEVHVWTTGTAHRSAKVLEAPGNVLWLAFFLPDRLAVASKDGSIVVRELQSGSCTERHDLGIPIIAFAMAPDGKLAVSSTKAGELTVWNTHTWTERTICRVSSATSDDGDSLNFNRTSLSFSPDSAHLAITINSSCELWDARIWTQIRQFQGHSGIVGAVQFSPDGLLLASASDDCTIRLWDLHIVESLRQDTPTTTAFALSPLGTTFATASSDRIVEARTVRSNEVVLTWHAERTDGLFQAMTISPDDSFLALRGESDGHVRIFDLRSGQPHMILECTAEQGVEHVSFRPDGRQVAFAMGRDGAEVWDLGSGTRVWKLPRPKRQRVIGVAFSPQKDLVACLEWSHCSLVDAISGETIVRWGSRPHSMDTQNSLAWSTDETRLLTCSWDGIIYIWDVASARASKQVRLLFHLDTEHRATVCSFFDGHRCIATDYGVFPIPPEHRPPCTAADLEPPSQEALLRLRDDGWIWRVRAGGDERRVCWLPLAYRPLWPTVGEDVIIVRDIIRLLVDSGRVVVIECRE